MKNPIFSLINNPLYLLLSIVVAVFTLEALIMLLLLYLPPMTPFQEVILDASLLSVMSFPILHLLVFRPIRIHIALRKKAEAEKDSLIRELQEAFEEVKTLRGLIPICASCKKIRNSEGLWQQIEDYITAHSDAEFSHGICQDCMKKLYPEFAERLSTL